MKKIELKLSLNRRLFINMELKAVRYQLNAFHTGNFAEVFDQVNKQAFIANYSDEYRVLFIYAPLYFKAWKKQKFLHFNVLNKDSSIIFKTDIISDLVDFLGCIK